MKYLAIRNRIYPKDLNHNGTAFGGFIMAEMDKAASIMVEEIIFGKAVTVFVDNLHFKYPLKNGDIISVYAEVKKIGHTSITLHVSFDARCADSKQEYTICDALFVFVAIDDNGKPRAVRPLIRDTVHQDVEALLKKKVK